MKPARGMTSVTSAVSSSFVVLAVFKACTRQRPCTCAWPSLTGLYPFFPFIIPLGAPMQCTKSMTTLNRTGMTRTSAISSASVILLWHVMPARCADTCAPIQQCLATKVALRSSHCGVMCPLCFPSLACPLQYAYYDCSEYEDPDYVSACEDVAATADPIQFAMKAKMFWCGC